jgi:hypothetical protein
MKKYIQPSVELIDMETTSIMAMSDGTLGISSETISDDEVLVGRKRNDSWSSYEDR